MEKERKQIVVPFIRDEKEVSGDSWKNYSCQINDKGELIITIPLTHPEFPTTSSGKGLLVASSHGFASIEGTTLRLSLNVTSPLPK